MQIDCIRILETDSINLLEIVDMINEGRKTGAFYGNPDVSLNSVNKYIQTFKEKHNYFLFASIVNKKVAGYSDICINSEGTGRILGIYIKPEFRSLKIGNIFIKFLIDHFKKLNCKEIITEVYTNNQLGKTFFTFNKFHQYKLTIESISGREIIIFKRII